MPVEQAEHRTIRLTGPITLYEVGTVRETLRKGIADGKPICLELSDSGPWDLAGIQLLVSFLKTVRDQGQPGRLAGVPRVCGEIAERCGLADWLRAYHE